MSLATQCPHCRTTFKVAKDQLKLQAGLVRCGVCQQVFNGIEQIVDVNANAEKSGEPIPPGTAIDGKMENQHLPTLSLSDIDHVDETIVLEPRSDQIEFDHGVLSAAQP